MVDLIVPSSGLHIDATFVLAPKYRLFRMEANATLTCGVDVTIRAQQAEFATGCLIDARGAPGPPGQNAPMSQAFGSNPGAAGGQGGQGGPGRNVAIEAGLAKVGQLTIRADGGPGGPGGSGQPGSPSQFLSSGSDGGPGGPGGVGGDGGKITLSWTRLAPSLPRTPDIPPPGHSYVAGGGPGGQGAMGGSTSGGNARPGNPGAPGASGQAGAVAVRWRSSLADMLWAQRQDMGPQPRWVHAMAHDPVRSRTVLFGGLTAGAAADDTWEWDGRLWTQVADTGPAARAGPAMTYDPVTGRVLLFGGRLSDGSLAGDTWTWDGEIWLQVEDSGPAPRAAHDMAADPDRQRVVLFGGDLTDPPVNVVTHAEDTWEWDGVSWLQVADSGPSARTDAKLAYSPDDAAMLLFGGSTVSDTWLWKAGQWTQVADSGPSARSGHALATTDGGVVLFGGRPAGAAKPPLRDTWGWVDQRWRQVQDMGPSAREGHAMVFDAANGGLVLFGGQSAAPALDGDTWDLRQR